MEKGLTYTSKVKVTQANTALALGSGDMEVFATPALVALICYARLGSIDGKCGDEGCTARASRRQHYGGRFYRNHPCETFGAGRGSVRHGGTGECGRTETGFQGDGFRYERRGRRSHPHPLHRRP